MILQFSPEDKYLNLLLQKADISIRPNEKLPAVCGNPYNMSINKKSFTSLLTLRRPFIINMHRMIHIYLHYCRDCLHVRTYL